MMQIGERVREKRNKLGLSLRELGLRTNLTAGFLSQLENDQISPSLNSLQSIATALEVPMFYFLDTTPLSTVVRANERRTLYFADSHIGYDLLAPELNRQMLPLLIKLEAGVRRVAMPLARSTEQWFFVMHGQMEITVGDETHLLQEGDSIYFDGDHLREFAAVGYEELAIVCCMVPPAL
jgi:transcriptional regulator with XRE-family HTH domain